jgi:ATP-dependent RNA helicase RhlE
MTKEHPMTPTQIHTSFSGLGLAPRLLDILTKKGFTVPTPIQSQAIPVAISGKDVMGIAQTGTGKTLAFGLPMLQSIAVSKKLGLIVLPTRELALQVNESLDNIGRSFGLKTAVLIGGENMNKQLMALRKQPHIIICTPGRLIDHLEQKTVRLDKVGILVLDEADRMLDMGFAPQLRRIMKTVPADRQTMLFSATMPAEIINIANSYMKLPMRVEVTPQGSTINLVTQEIIFVEKHQKPDQLKKILTEYTGSTLVFTRTKFGAKKIAQMLRTTGHTSAEIHSNRSLNQRIEALNGFKSGKYRVLVATDIAARGIDVTGIELVVNYDLPEQAADYVHRIGRTGRAGLEGHAISLATPDQRRDVMDIERLIKKQLPITKVAFSPAPPRSAEMDRPQFARRDEGRRDFGPSTSSGSYDRSRSSRSGDRSQSSKPNPFSSRPPRHGFGNDRGFGRPSSQAHGKYSRHRSQSY